MKKVKEKFRVNLESGTIHNLSMPCGQCMNSYVARPERYKDCHLYDEAVSEMHSRRKSARKCSVCHW